MNGVAGSDFAARCSLETTDQLTGCAIYSPQTHLTTRSIVGIGPPAPLQKSTTATGFPSSPILPKTLSNTRPARTAGDVCCSGHTLCVHANVSMFCTGRRIAGGV